MTETDRPLPDTPPFLLRPPGGGADFRKPGLLGRIRRRAAHHLYPVKADAARYWCGVIGRFDGLRFAVDTRDHIARSVLENGTYEPHVTAFIERHVGPGAVCVDGGANIGVHTLTMARLAGPAGRVVSFEPNLLVAKILLRNLALNDLRNVVVRREALGSETTALALRVPLSTSSEGGNAGLASLVALETGHETVTVPVVRLDVLAEELGVQRVDFVKLDLQGFEPQGLMGMRDIVARDRPLVILEVDRWALEAGGHSVQWIVNHFSGLDYTLRSLALDGWPVAFRSDFGEAVAFPSERLEGARDSTLRPGGPI